MSKIEEPCAVIPLAGICAGRLSDWASYRDIKETCQKQNIKRGQLTIHADRGSSMKSKKVAFLLSDLGVTKSHSRPYVSNDNPYSESHFKTMKYRPEYPKRFFSIAEARAFCRSSLIGIIKSIIIPELDI